MGCAKNIATSVKTPNMDRLAREGMIFDNAYCTVPVCGPTRASLATAEYPQMHKQYGNSTFLNQAGPDGQAPCLVQPHWPFSAPEMMDGIPFYSMYQGKEGDDGIEVDMPDDKREGFDLKEYFWCEQKYKKNRWGQVRPELTRLSRARYYSAISWVDHMLGQIMNKLEELDDPINPGKKLSETTILCYTSDHGDMMGEKGLWWKMNMFDSSARIPFIVKKPGVIQGGQRSSCIINYFDFFPTLAGLAGLGDNLPETTGQDISKAIEKNDPELGRERSVSMQSVKEDHSVQPGGMMSRTERFKFIREPKKRPDGKPYIILFDMQEDPHETRNLAFDSGYRKYVEEENAALNEMLGRYGTPEMSV